MDRDSTSKDLGALDIPLPILSPRVVRQPNALSALDPRSIPFQPLTYQTFSDDQLREIVFRDISTGDVSHTTVLDPATVVDYRNVLGYFAQTLCHNTKLFSSQATLYGHLKRFIQHDLFGQSIDLEAANTLRNLAEPPATRAILDTFTKAINAVTVHDRGGAQIVGQLSLLATRPFMVKPQPFLVPHRSVFNRIVADRDLELSFAEFLDSCPDALSFAKITSPSASSSITPRPMVISPTTTPISLSSSATARWSSSKPRAWWMWMCPTKCDAWPSGLPISTPCSPT